MNNNRGFTLIELLVTMTIAVMLTTLTINGYQSVLRNSRDTTKKTEIERVRTALELYRATVGSYPTDTNCVPNGMASYLPTFPRPSTGTIDETTVYLCYNQLTTQTYELCAHLENGDTSDSCNASTGNCGLSSLAAGDKNCNYEKNNP